MTDIDLNAIPGVPEHIRQQMLDTETGTLTLNLETLRKVASIASEAAKKLHHQATTARFFSVCADNMCATAEDILMSREGTE